MLGRLPATSYLFALLTLVTLAVPAAANSPDARCRQSLAAASAGIEATRAQVATVRGDERCVAYRRHFLEVVKARAVAARCTSGVERAQDLGRLDSTVEEINSLIAEGCGS